MQSQPEWRADIITQISGLVLAVAGSALLLVRSASFADGLALTAVGIYGASLLAMFSFSILNANARLPGRKAWIQALDHSAIFALIAGTYTPFCLLAVGGTRGTLVLAGLWVAAVAGMMARFVFHRWLREAHITLYVLMGWAGLAVAPSLLDRISTAGGVLILTGGVIYTVAAPLYRLTRLRYHSAVWHACVVAAAGCHYAAVLLALNAYAA